MLELVVHATHEAGAKVGGIEAGLDGLLAAEEYNNAIKRTVLVGPYNAGDTVEQGRLHARRNHLTIRYNATEGITDVPEALANAFHEVQTRYAVSILYGTRRFGRVEHEVLLVDSSHAIVEPVNDLKAYLYARHGIQSERYEVEPEFNHYMGAAPAMAGALQALVGELPNPAFFIAHDWSGLPALFATERQMSDQYHTIFYAHETATVRTIIEGHPGHDLRFYNAMRVARDNNLSLEQVFGSQTHFYKHALLRAALFLDGLFVIGDLVREELEFLEPQLRDRRVDPVYKGVPSALLGIDEKRRSKELLRQYARALHGFEPTWVFSHVTPLTESKGIWRDFAVMERVDRLLADRGESVVFYLLSTVEPAGRRSEDVHRWEQEYGWPVQHRADNGDLIGQEWEYYQMTERFNREARTSRAVFVNQVGWNRDCCGERMPREMELLDLRQGTDLEFGQSIYEPFGLAQVEPLSFGALCVLSTACGCLGFMRDAGSLDLANVVIGDYLYLPAWSGYGDLSSILHLGTPERDAIEAMVAEQVARKIDERLPRTENDLATLLEQGCELAARMSWEVVVREYLLPALNRIAA